MKKEITIFLVLLLVLSLVIHQNEFLNFPIEHISNLSNSGAYGLGIFHPLIFTFIVYIVLWIPRGIFKAIKKG